jgi:hypothetical protein
MLKTLFFVKLLFRNGENEWLAALAAVDGFVFHVVLNAPCAGKKNFTPAKIPGCL